MSRYKLDDRKIICALKSNPASCLDKFTTLINVIKTWATLRCERAVKIFVSCDFGNMCWPFANIAYINDF